MQQQISGTVRILISPHIPAANRLAFIQQRSVKFIFTCYSAAGSIADMGIFIVHIVRMHIHHILAGRRTFHDFHTLAYTIRAKNSTWLHRQYNTFELPVHQIIRWIATETRKSIALVRLIFPEKIISAILFHNAGTVRIDNLSPVVKPGNSVIYYFFGFPSHARSVRYPQKGK